MYHKILLPLDGSELSNATALAGIQLAHEKESCLSQFDMDQNQYRQIVI